jgi:hypothetical protein
MAEILAAAMTKGSELFSVSCSLQGTQSCQPEKGHAAHKIRVPRQHNRHQYSLSSRGADGKNIFLGDVKNLMGL